MPTPRHAVGAALIGDWVYVAGGGAVLAEGQALAWRIAQASGAGLLADFVVGRVSRGRGRLPLERVPYIVDAAVRALAPYQDIVLVNAKVPVGFFAYPGKPSVLHAPDAQVHVLSHPEQDPLAALRALAAGGIQQGHMSLHARSVAVA